MVPCLKRATIGLAFTLQKKRTELFGSVPEKSDDRPCVYTKHLGSVLVLERFRSSLVSLKCETLSFRSRIVLVFSSVNGQERNFLVTIENGAKSRVEARLSENVKLHCHANTHASHESSVLFSLV